MSITPLMTIKILFCVYVTIINPITEINKTIQGLMKTYVYFKEPFSLIDY